MSYGVALVAGGIQSRGAYRLGWVWRRLAGGFCMCCVGVRVAPAIEIVRVFGSASCAHGDLRTAERNGGCMWGECVVEELVHLGVWAGFWATLHCVHSFNACLLLCLWLVNMLCIDTLMSALVHFVCVLDE